MRKNTTFAFVGSTATIFMVALCCGVISSWAAPGSRWLPISIPICFLATLIVTHLWCVANRGKLPLAITKVFDYVYLFVTGIGLVISVAQYNAQQFRDNANNIVDHFIGFFISDIKSFRSLESGCKPVESRACISFSDSIDRFEQAVGQLRSFRSFAKIDAAIQTFQAADDRLKKTNAYIAHTPNIVDNVHEREQAFVKNTIDKMNENKPLFNIEYYDHTKLFGFFLIGSAIALRVTKVSVEYFAWEK